MIIKIVNKLIPFMFVIFSSCLNLNDRTDLNYHKNLCFRMQESALLSETYSSIKLFNSLLTRDDGKDMYLNDLVMDNSPFFLLDNLRFLYPCIEKQLVYYNNLSENFDERMILIGRYDRLNDLRSVKMNLDHDIFLMKDNIIVNHYNEPISFILLKDNFMFKTKFHNNISGELTKAYYAGISNFLSYRIQSN